MSWIVLVMSASRSLLSELSLCLMSSSKRILVLRLLAYSSWRSLLLSRSLKADLKYRLSRIKSKTLISLCSLLRASAKLRARLEFWQHFILSGSLSQMKSIGSRIPWDTNFSRPLSPYSTKSLVTRKLSKLL